MIEFFKPILTQHIQALYPGQISPEHIQINETRKDFTGDLTLVTFPLAKISQQSPEQTAQTVGAYLVSNMPQIESFNVVKGFLNLSLTQSFLLQQFKAIQAQKDCYGLQPENHQQVLVEYCSPNTNKPLHLGHVRNNLLGYSVANILGANGNKVVKTQIINDRGIHICKSMIAWEKYAQGATPQSTGLKGDKLVGEYYVKFDQHYKTEVAALIASGLSEAQAKEQAPILQEARAMLQKWEEGDAKVLKLWETMNNWVYQGFEQTHERLGINFDAVYYESNTYLTGKQIVDEGLASGVFYKKEDGSVWCDLSPEGLDEKLVLRADGTSVYITQDLGTAILRFRDYPQSTKQIYTVGNEQDYHFKVLFLMLQKLGYTWAKHNYHLSYGMMELPSGKMKSREGTVVDADDLMYEMYQTAKATTEELGKLDGLAEQDKEQLYWHIGLGALKYFILKVDPKKKMLFNPQESIDFNGNTGPFIQYTHARTSAISRKAQELNISAQYSEQELTLAPTERGLILLLLQYPQIIQEAAQAYSPALLANYLYELAKTYNQFYQSVPIFKESNANQLAFRVQLNSQTTIVLKSGLSLLGIHAPERM